MRLTDEQFTWAVAEYESGRSIAAIAEDLPCGRQALWERMKRAGIEMRPQMRFGSDNHFYRGGALGADWAHNKVEKAILRGKLVRPEACEECGGTGPEYRDGRSSIQAHHDDYNDPLAVRWLCKPCHDEWHKHNTPIPLREGEPDELDAIPEGGDAQGSLFEVEPVDLLVGGFPRGRAKASAPPVVVKDSGIPRLVFGANSSASFAYFDPATSSLRTSQGSLLSPPPEASQESFSERYSRAWPRAGSMRAGIVYRLPPLAPLTAAIACSSPLLPTPTVNDAKSLTAPSQEERHSPGLPTVVRMLPTPRASLRQTREATPETGRGGGGDRGETLPSAVAKLLPTPNAQDGRPDGKSNTRGAGSIERGGGVMLMDAALKMLPTPNASLANYSEEPEQWARRPKHKTEPRAEVGDSSLPLPVAVKRLLPTPLVADAEGGRTSKGQDRPDEAGLRVTVKRLLPTPTTKDSANSRRAMLEPKHGSTAHPGTTLLDAALLSSGESTAPRSAAGRSSSAGLRLNPSFVEWMMGCPVCSVCGAGWSDPACPHSATEFSFRPAGSAEPASSTTPAGAEVSSGIPPTTPGPNVPPEEQLRRLKDFMGVLPPRPFLLRGDEAHMLISALEEWANGYREYARTDEGRPSSALDVEADAEALAHAHDLAGRLREFLGFTRMRRTG